jgi:hypothetical protein
MMNLQKAKKMLHFRKLVSYKHESAIQVLKTWFDPEFKVELERKFYVDSVLAFVPDITLTQDGTIRAVYEVVHTHGLTGKKYALMQYWCFFNYDFPVYEINADYVLNQTEKPNLIESDKFYTITK